MRYLHCMPDGRMLVATVSGLIMFEPSDSPELTTFTMITKIPGDRYSLGNNDVIHMFTDSKGCTWLSTFGGGLNRLYFEGDLPRFEIISTDDGLASNIVHSATEDHDGVICLQLNPVSLLMTLSRHLCVISLNMMESVLHHSVRRHALRLMTAV